MRSLAELPVDALKVAREAAQTLMRFKAYMPPGGLLLMLVSKFGDDVGDVLCTERDPLPQRGRERRPLDELTSVELDTVSGATGILLDRFSAYMDDPELPKLLDEYRDALNRQKAERAQLRAEIGA